jgi:predicted nucleotidyltransferase
MLDKGLNARSSDATGDDMATHLEPRGSARVSAVDEVRRKRPEILEIAARHGAHNVRLFGSFARGDARADSDLDLLVDAGPAHSAFFPAALIADLQDLLKRDVDVVETAALHWYLRERVLLEAVPL